MVCYRGGVRILEFINWGDFVYEVFVEFNKFVLKELFGLIMGVGLVVDVVMVLLYL